MEKIKWVWILIPLINFGYSVQFLSVEDTISYKMGEIIWKFYVGGPTGDSQCLAVEFDGDFFWISGENSGGDTKRLYKFNSDGTLEEVYVVPFLYRDLTWDGEYLWGASGSLYQIDPFTGQWTGNVLNLQNLAMCVAYDPITDHFFTAFYNTPIYEWDREGNLIATYPNEYTVVGLAWDGASPGGPYLWVSTQEDNGFGGLNVIHQYNLRTDTWKQFSICVNAGGQTGYAGGICFTTEWNFPLGTLFELIQTYSNDFVVGFYISGSGISKEKKLYEPPNGPHLMTVPSKMGFDFHFSIPEKSPIHFKIYDLRGRLVNFFNLGILEEGAHIFHWNLRDRTGRNVPKGVYLLLLETAKFKIRDKLLILR
jgi:hypothetical protein